MNKPLTDNMKKALMAVGFGVRKYDDGYYSEDDPTERVNANSLDALHKRELITWHSEGGAPHQIHLNLTEKGSEIFEEIRHNV